MTNPRRTILTAIDDHDDDTAPITDVVNRALAKHEPTAVFEAFAELIRDGEIYEAERSKVRRTRGVRDPDDGGD